MSISWTGVWWVGSIILPATPGSKGDTDGEGLGVVSVTGGTGTTITTAERRRVA